MTKISDLPRDLTEDVILKLPMMTSQRSVRLTCKKWNNLYKNRSFIKKVIGEAKKKYDEEFDVVMMLESKVFLFTVNLDFLSSPSLKRIGEFISLDCADRVEISEIFHCDGLLLCVPNPKERSRILVSNPLCGQTKWIEPLNSYHRWDKYALGYEKNEENSYKILRFIDTYDGEVTRVKISEFEIFDINTNSWKILVVTPDWGIEFRQRGLSLKGNTYWYAREKLPYDAGSISDAVDFLLCFDFTTETFGPRLPLPFHAFRCTVTLSSVRDEQLAILLQRYDTLVMDIWITTKIEPTAVSWSKFLSVDMKPLTGFEFNMYNTSFFIDEKKKVAVVVDKDRSKFQQRHFQRHIMAYIIGEKGYLRKVDLGKSLTSLIATPCALVCSYVPSSVQILQANHNTP